jgi:hypothetical protein
MYILAVGNIIEGFIFLGAFATQAEAEVYGEKHFSEHEWWIAPLITADINDH